MGSNARSTPPQTSAARFRPSVRATAALPRQARGPGTPSLTSAVVWQGPDIGGERGVLKDAHDLEALALEVAIRSPTAACGVCARARPRVHRMRVWYARVSYDACVSCARRHVCLCRKLS
jgi:hypothetical protein